MLPTLNLQMRVQIPPADHKSGPGIHMGFEALFCIGAAAAFGVGLLVVQQVELACRTATPAAPHSYRSATSGSTRVARRAGTQQGTRPVTRDTPATDASV